MLGIRAFFAIGNELWSFLCITPSNGAGHCPVVGLDGLEPSTSRLSGARSNHLSYKPLLCVDSSHLSARVAFRRGLRPLGGDDGIRTHDPLLAGQVLSQLSYTPIPRALFFSRIISGP